MELDSVQIGAPEAAAATTNFKRLLDCEPEPVAGGWRFALAHGAVEITTGDAGLHAVGFCAAEHDAITAEMFDANGVRVVRRLSRPAARVTTRTAIDHIVIQSPHLDRARTFWRDRIGLRLALDREFPRRGLRMLFFRSAGMTLEIVGALDVAAADAPDRLYGVAFTVDDLAGRRAALLEQGFDLSEIRPGQKSGTVVASVRSHTGGVPVLLIQTER